MLTECYKTINQLNGLEPTDYFIFAHDFCSLRANHHFKLKLKTAKLNSYKYSFFIRVINDWNNVPEEIAESKNLDIFKNRLKCFFKLKCMYVCRWGGKLERVYLIYHLFAYYLGRNYYYYYLNHLLTGIITNYCKSEYIKVQTKLQDTLDLCGMEKT